MSPCPGHALGGSILEVYIHTAITELWKALQGVSCVYTRVSLSLNMSVKHLEGGVSALQGAIYMCVCVCVCVGGWGETIQWGTLATSMSLYSTYNNYYEYTYTHCGSENRSPSWCLYPCLSSPFLPHTHIHTHTQLHMTPRHGNSLNSLMQVLML